MSHPDLSVADAALRRGVSTKTIRRLIARGELRAYRVGPRLIRIRQEDLESLGRPIPTRQAS